MISKITTEFNWVFFLAPNMLGFFTFTFLPVLASLMLCFTDWDILTEIRYIGFSNFINLLGFHRDIVANTLVANDPLFWKYLGILFSLF